MQTATAAAPRQALKLRDYQEQALDAIASNFFEKEYTHKVWRQLVVLPTGCGKTVVVAGMLNNEAIAAWIAAHHQVNQKILMIAHREELLEQAADKIAWANPDLFIEIEKAERRASPMADVVIASVQTLAARAGRRMERFDAEQFRVVIVDEAHHAAAPTYQLVLKHFGFLPPDEFMPPTRKFDSGAAALEFQRERLREWDEIAPKDKLLVGITATPKRGDNIGLEAIFQDVVFSRNIREMIEAGYLCRMRAIRVQSDTSLDTVHTRAGDFDQNELADAVDTEERNKLAVKALLEHAPTRKAIVFAVTVQHAKDIAEEFRKAGIRAAVIHGNMSSDERRDVLYAFHTNQLQVLANCAILTEGFDEPSVDCIIHAKPTKSSLLYIQMTGRGTRICPGKPDCLVIDIVDVTKRHSLVTTPELLGLPAGFDAKGEDVLNVAKRVEEIQKKHDYLDLNGAKSLDDVRTRAEEVDLFNVTDEMIDQHARLQWIKANDGYSLMFQNDDRFETVQIRQDALGKWQIGLVVGGRAEHIGTQPDLPNAFHTAEKWMDTNRRMQAKMKDRAAPWRGDKASPAQISYLKMLGAPIREGLSKGDASNLIEAYKSRSRTKRATRRLI